MQQWKTTTHFNICKWGAAVRNASKYGSGIGTGHWAEAGRHYRETINFLEQTVKRLTFKDTESGLKNQERNMNILLENEGRGVLVILWQKAYQNCLLNYVENKTCKG